MHLGFFGLGFISVFELVLSLDLVLDLYWGFLNKLYIYSMSNHIRIPEFFYLSFFKILNKFDAKIIIFAFRFFLDLGLGLVIDLGIGLTDCATIH